MARNRADLTRQALERDEDARLALFAMRSARARRAVPRDPEGRLFDYRTEYQRDRDRILHCRAFRRLKLKSNGGSFPPEERLRDRLTHTLEVSQLARTVSRGLGLNEDLVEAIAHGHDLGTPPFGRAGESVLAELVGGKGGGFNAVAQSLRVVDVIEKWYTHSGLNLTDATRQGIGQEAAAPFFEAQVVSAVDALSTPVQELDDGLRSGEIDIEEAHRLPVVREVLTRISPGGTRTLQRGGLHIRAGAIYRGLMHLLVTGLIENSRRLIEGWAKKNDIATHEAFLGACDQIDPSAVSLSPRLSKLFVNLSGLVERRIYQGAWWGAATNRARRVLTGIYRELTGDPRLAEDYLLLRFKQEQGGSYLRDLNASDVAKEIKTRYRNNPGFARIVTDHIAGMTDLFAVTEYERLLGLNMMRGGSTR